jgi:potassium/hydrogen antiporter
MSVEHVFAVIAGIILIGFASEWVFRKTNIPDVLVLITIGIILGSVLRWVTPSDLPGSMIFATFALVFILFQGALNIHSHDLLDSLSPTLRLTLISFVLSSALVTAISFFLGLSPIMALLLGLMLGGTASAVVIPMVHNLKMDTKTRTVLTLESGINDVLCIVGAITIMNIIMIGEVSTKSILTSLMLSFGVAVIVGVIFGLVWIYLLYKYSTLNSAYMVSIAVVLLTYACVEGLLDSNGAIAALSFGLILGNSRKIMAMINRFRDEEEQPGMHLILTDNVKLFYSEIAFFVKVFFFVYLGIIMDFSNPWVFFWGAIITVGIFLIRPLSVRLAYGDTLQQHDRTLLEVLTPNGLAPVVLVHLAVEIGVPGAADLVPTVLAVVLISTLLTAFLVFLAEQHWFKGFWVPLHRPQAAAPQPPQEQKLG